MTNRNMRRPAIGETLYLRLIGNMKNRQGESLSPVVVESVGRKYFRCNKKEYCIDSWVDKSNYSPCHMLYESEQIWKDEIEYEELFSDCRHKFMYFGDKQIVSLENIRKIKDILYGEKEDHE